jgi:hypothetical protein
MIARGTSAPKIKPAIGSHQGCKGIKTRSIKKRNKKNRLTLSGITIYFKSATVTIIQSEISDHPINNSFDQPKSKGETEKRTAVRSSIVGYRGEIVERQFLHLPVCSMYDKTGINSIALRFLLQTGHAETGDTIDLFNGMRKPTTLKKEPSTAPSINRYENRKMLVGIR